MIRFPARLKGCPLRLFFCNWTCLASIILTDDSSLSRCTSSELRISLGEREGRRVVVVENKIDFDGWITLYIYIYIYPLCVIFNSWLRQGICKKIGSCNYLNEW